ncbi:endogenous retrovirus group K member 5 Gag polyprotein-like [Lepidochelys kempii]|uniref:endogenous retrovirus group K member 5 Gag polyprotein-like n=1 Tax=Lepidochelys kempii TaxID=8472 RepID=UPI003C7007D0
MGPHAPGPPGGSSASAQGLSLVQQMVHAAKTRPDLTAEELADLVSVCPVTWQDDGQGNQLANWVSLPYSVIREIEEAILRQVDKPAAAQEILLKMAVENANEDCRRALQAAQAAGVLELSDMLRACQNIGTQARKAGVLAAALRKSRKEGKRCYCCGPLWVLARCV